jgi:hypothetical protein
MADSRGGGGDNWEVRGRLEGEREEEKGESEGVGFGFLSGRAAVKLVVAQREEGIVAQEGMVVVTGHRGSEQS